MGNGLLSGDLSQVAPPPSPAFWRSRSRRPSQLPANSPSNPASASHLHPPWADPPTSLSGGVERHVARWPQQLGTCQIEYKTHHCRRSCWGTSWPLTGSNRHCRRRHRHQQFCLSFPPSNWNIGVYNLWILMICQNPWRKW